MRIEKTFGERKRTANKKEAAKKFYFLCEGEETEVQYFDGVNANRSELGISGLIEIKHILRSYSEKGWSNPKKIVERLNVCIENSRNGVLMLKDIIDSVIECIDEERLLTKRSLYKEADIRRIIIEHYKKKGISEEALISDKESVAEEISSFLKSEANITSVAEKISYYLKKQNITYDEKLDSICIIVDRDKESFKDEQYDDVKRICKEKGYDLYISNPCFEFWLLLHFNEVFNLDRKKLLDNQKVSKRLKYTESELKKILPHYRKERVPFSDFKYRINRAIENERRFCQDTTCLKNNVGCNIGLLFKKLREV